MKNLFESVQKFHKYPTDYYLWIYLSNFTKNPTMFSTVFKKKKKQRSQIPIGRDFDFIRYFVSSHQTRVGENTMEWNKGSHGREIVPFSRLNFIMRGEIESRRSITRGSREIPRRFSRPTPPPQNSSHSRLAFSVSVENLACGGCASTPAADTKSEHVRSRRRASLQRCFVTFLLSKTVRLGCLGSF